MKTILKLIPLLAACTLLWSGCAVQNGSSANTYTSTEDTGIFEVSGDEEVLFAYGFGLVSPSVENNLIYDGMPVQVEYYIDNYAAAMKAGLLVFVNGHLQAYSVGDSDASFMQIQEIQALEKEIFSISFNPVVGNEGDILDVRFLSVLNPDIRPDSLRYIYGSTNKMTTFFPRQLEIQYETSNETSTYPNIAQQRDMTEEEINQVIYVNYNGSTVNKMTSFHLIVRNSEDVGETYLLVENEKIAYTLQCYGGNATEYILYPFVNNVPVFNDEYPCTVTVEDGTKILDGEYTLDLSMLDHSTYHIEQYNTFYIVAVPTDGSADNWPVMSTSYVFSGDGL